MRKDKFVPLRDEERERRFEERAKKFAESSPIELKKHEGDLGGNRCYLLANYFSYEYPKNTLLRACAITVAWKLYGADKANHRANPHIEHLKDAGATKELRVLVKIKTKLDRQRRESRSAA